MAPDIDKMLSYEIKKEIADRYFGFRKLIEEDIKEYDSMIVATLRRLEQRIGFDLVRLYILLKNEQVIHDFFHITGLDERLFYDPYLAESPTIRKRVFSGVQPHGMTRKNRFKNMVVDNYNNLVRHIGEYNDNLQQLREEQETIAEEINLFYQKNDLSTIMGFLRGLGGTNSYKSGSMEGGLTPLTGQNLEKKMRVKAPPPVEKILPVLPEIQPYKKIKHELDPIIDRAYRLQGEPEMRNFIF